MKLVGYIPYIVVLTGLAGSGSLTAQESIQAAASGADRMASLPDTWNAAGRFQPHQRPQRRRFTYGVGLLPGQFARMTTVRNNVAGTPHRPDQQRRLAAVCLLCSLERHGRQHLG